MADTIRILGQTAGDDYATVAAMEAAIPANIVTHGGDNWVVRVRADANYEGFSFPQVTTDATHQLIFEAFPGSEVDGAGVGAGFENATGGFSGFMGSVITSANTAHIQYVGLKIIALGTSQSAIWLQECSNKIFKDCFVKSDLFVGIEVANGGACEIEFINTIIADCGSDGTSYGNTSASADIRYDRCTVVNSTGQGFDDRGFGTAGALYGRNLFSFGNSGLDFAVKLDASDYDFLASEDTSATAEDNGNGFNGRTTADFVNYAGGNYSLAVGSSLRTAGVGGVPIGAILPAVAPPAALTLTAETGTYALAGIASDLLANRRIVSDRGTFVLSGQDATLLYAVPGGFTLAADAGAFVLAGQAADLLFNRRVVANRGTFVLGGQDVTFLLSSPGQFTIIADPGVFALTGRDAEFRFNRRMLLDAGVFTLGGQDVLFQYGVSFTLAAETGSFALTGIDLSFLRSYVMDMGRGLFTLNGRSVIFPFNIQVQPDGVTLIKLKRRHVDATAPTLSDLSEGEMAVNTYTGKMYMRDNSSNIILLGGLQDGIGLPTTDPAVVGVFWNDSGVVRISEGP